MTGQLVLSPFVDRHPPHHGSSPVSSDLLREYRGQVPDSLLELWEKYGFGFYGSRQIALVDPTLWQATLDRWIVSPPEEARRIPIALTPFGLILYYRSLTVADEDVAVLDPHKKSTDVLAWSLTDFFNGFLSDAASVDALIPPGMLRAAEAECGPLALGEVYEADQTLLVMQMLKIRKVDALAMHKALRDAVDPPKPPVRPETVAVALPAEYRSAFADKPDKGEEIAGLYLSKYVDWFRLLRLGTDGKYGLLFWRIHHKTGERQEIRAYSGSYSQWRDSNDDHHVRLEIKLNRVSLGSDADDADLVVATAGDMTRLLRTSKLAEIASAIQMRGKLGRSEYYFRRIRLDDPLPRYGSDGEDALAVTDGVPSTLRALLSKERR